MACVSDDGDGRGVGDALVSVHFADEFGMTAARELLEGNLHHAQGCDFSVVEGVDGDAASGVGVCFAGGVVRFIAERVGEAVHADVKLAAVAAEGETGVERLFGSDEGAVVGEVRHLAGFCVEHGERLHVVGVE